MNYSYIATISQFVYRNIAISQHLAKCSPYLCQMLVFSQIKISKHRENENKRQIFWTRGSEIESGSKLDSYEFYTSMGKINSTFRRHNYVPIARGFDSRYLEHFHSKRLPPNRLGEATPRGYHNTLSLMISAINKIGKRTICLGMHFHYNWSCDDVSHSQSRYQRRSLIDLINVLVPFRCQMR